MYVLASVVSAASVATSAVESTFFSAFAPKNSAADFASTKPNVDVSTNLPIPAPNLSKKDTSSCGAASNISSAPAAPYITSYAPMIGNNHGTLAARPFAPVFAT